MALGFMPTLLARMQQLANPNYGGTKITASGFLGALIENSPNLAVSLVTTATGQTIVPGSGMHLNTASGQLRDVVVKYMPRILQSQIGDQDDCTTDFVMHYKEQTINAPFYKQAAFYLDWNFLERYEADAVRSINIGLPAIGAVKELDDQIMHVLNGLVGAIDTTLLNTVDWGVNAVTGNDTATPININRAGNTLDLNDGLIRMLADVQNNEIADMPILVGNGLLNNLFIARRIGATGLNQAGFNIGAGDLPWYYDINSIGAWGSNVVGAFAKGSIGLVDIEKWIGWKTGHFGTSWFAQAMFPIGTPSSAGLNVPAPLMSFNIQVQEVDCPGETIATGYGEGTYSAGRGWRVLISKNFGLWQYPVDSFQPTDRLSGVNGALKYVVTNDCDGCAGE